MQSSYLNCSSATGQLCEHCGHQEALSLASHVLGRLEAYPEKNVLFTASAVRGLRFTGPMEWHSMNSLLQHLAQTVLDVPNAAEAPETPEGPPPHQGSPRSLCDPRRVAGASGPREIGAYRAPCQGAGGDKQFHVCSMMVCLGFTSTLCPCCCCCLTCFSSPSGMPW